MTHIPLHHPTYSPADYKELTNQLREKAMLAYTMFAYAGMIGAKRMIALQEGVVPGFRAAFVNRRLAAADIEGRVGGVPNRKQRRRTTRIIKNHWIEVRKNEAEAAKKAASAG